MRWIAAALVVAVACGGGGAGGSVEIDGHRFHVEIADDADEQQRGLMNRTELAEDAGMLFVFSDTEERSFYMKDTLIPLDLIAIDGGRVVSIATMTPCEATPCPTTRTAPARYVLEINGGLADRLGFEVGDPVAIEGAGTPAGSSRS